MKKPYILLIIIIAFFIITPVVIYFVFFQSQLLSNNPNDWGAFGSYLSGIAGFGNIIVIGSLMWIIYEKQKNIEIENQSKIEQQELKNRNLQKEILKNQIAVDLLKDLRKTRSYFNEILIKMELVAEGKDVDISAEFYYVKEKYKNLFFSKNFIISIFNINEIEFNKQFSYIEIYLDFLRDLYNNDNKPLVTEKYDFITKVNMKIADMPANTDYQKQEAFVFLLIFTVFEEIEQELASNIVL
ncbi:MAG: hypothetical protein WBG43_03310 [Marinifilaceae bacterium]